MQHRYSSSDVCRLAEITYRQLDYWVRTAVLVPWNRTGEGSGTQREFDRDQLILAIVIQQLLNCGMSMQAIGRAVRAGDLVQLCDLVANGVREARAQLVGA